MKSEEVQAERVSSNFHTKGNKPVRITATEAASLQWQLVDTWKSRRDVWPFYYGVCSLGAASAATSVFYNSYYRKVTKLGHYGHMASLFPAIVIPSAITIIAHLKWISSDVLIRKTRCSVCVELRAVAIQLACGVLYPMIMAPLSSFLIASQYYTYTVPPFKPIREYAAHWWKITRPLTNRIHASIVLLAAAAATITFLQYDSIDKVNMKLDEEAIKLKNVQ